MKATVLYCDRCAGEGKPAVAAAHVAWIRTSAGGRSLRLDVCPEHLAMILGSPNGASPSAQLSRWSMRGGGGLMQKTYERILQFIEKHPRFSLEQLSVFLGKDCPTARIGRVLTVLVEERKIERYHIGLYQHPGYNMPEPASVELAAAAVLKLVKHEPGIRGAMAAPLLGISLPRWKQTLAYIREQKVIRTKGNKSGMRLYPV